MDTNFFKSIRFFLIVSSTIGMSNFSYYNFNSKSMMVKSGSSILFLLESSRMLLLLSCTYIVLRMPFFYLRYAQLVRFWAMIVLSRMLKNRFVRLANGMIEFDQKIATLPLQVADHSPPPAFWKTVTFFYFIFNVLLHAYTVDKITTNYHWHTLFLNSIEMIFVPPRAMDFITTAGICFYMSNFGHRFIALNEIWRGLLGDSQDTRLVPARRKRMTTTETAILVEYIRILHAELSDLLRTFNTAFGPIVLFLFVFFFVDTMFDSYYMLVFKDFTLGYAPCFQYTQTLFFIVCILSFCSWNNNMKKELVKNLRASQIINLKYKAIMQIKLFMEQINVYEQTETLACGMLDYKLPLLLSVMVLLITVSATFIQMKDQTFFMDLFNKTYDDGPWFSD